MQTENAKTQTLKELWEKSGVLKIAAQEFDAGHFLNI